MWYKTGTVAVTSGQTLVTGSGTLWSINVKPGDAFTLDGTKIYEVASLDVTNPDTKLYLRVAYTGSTLSGQAYSVMNLSTVSISTATLAAQVSALLNGWQTRETEFTTWQGGLATAGFDINGTPASGSTAGYFPLTDALGAVHYLACPSKQLVLASALTLGGFTASQTPGASQIPVKSAANNLVLASGNVLIGTTTDDTANKLQVVGTTSVVNAGNAFVAATFKSDAADTVRLWRPQSGLSSAAGRIIFGGQNIASIQADYASTCSMIESNGSGTHSGSLAFATTTAGSLTEKARVTSGGNLLIGKTVDDTYNKLQVAGVASFLGVQSVNNSGSVAIGNGQVVRFQAKNTTANWQKAATITLSVGTYRGISLTASVKQMFYNQSSLSGSNQGIGNHRFKVNVMRSGTVDLDTERALLIGTSTDFVRVVKTQAGTGVLATIYELQYRQPGLYQDLTVEFEIISAGTSGVMAWAGDAIDGSTVGTVYSPTATITSEESIFGMANNNILIGSTADNGFAKLQTSNGLTLGNTANVNPTVLDWYQEGTFTPVIIGGTTAGAATYTVQTGNYTRIGNVVYINLRLTYSGHTGTGNMQITGMPWAPVTSSCALSIWQSGLIIGAGKQLSVVFSTSSNTIALYANDDLGGVQIGVSMDVTADIMITGTYSLY